jgi:hypothetical protein
MQPTDQQVQRSLDALRRGDDPAIGRELDRRLAEVPTEVFRRLRREPSLRPERLERALRRLACGEAPSAQDLADRMVGRLVCDRLR